MQHEKYLYIFNENFNINIQFWTKINYNNFGEIT